MAQISNVTRMIYLVFFAFVWVVIMLPISYLTGPILALFGVLFVTLNLRNMYLRNRRRSASPWVGLMQPLWAMYAAWLTSLMVSCPRGPVRRLLSLLRFAPVRGPQLLRRLRQEVMRT